MTLKHLMRARATLDQYEILQRADVIFAVGRYYGGTLTDAEIETLTPKPGHKEYKP